MNKFIKIILWICINALFMVTACSSLNNNALNTTYTPTIVPSVVSSPTEATVITQGTTPAGTARLTNDEFFKLEQTLNDNKKFAGSHITFTMQEYAQSGDTIYTAKLSVDDGGKSLTADYGQIWNATEYPDDIEIIDMEKGMFIYLKFVLGHGQYEAPVLAWYDGDSLEFIKWQFSDLSFYDWQHTYKHTFEDEPAPLFDFNWTGDTTFDLTCNLGGETMHYEVNTQYHDSTVQEKYADLDRDKNPPEINEFFITGPTDKGEVKLEARLTYGEHLIIAVNANITLQFDEESRSLVFKNIEYFAEGDLSTNEYAVTEVN